MNVATITLEEAEFIRNKTAKPLLWVGMVSIVMLFGGLTSAIIVRRAEANWMLFEFPQAFYISTALIIYATFIAVNYYRRVAGASPEIVRQFMQQTINHSVAGHSTAAAFVNNVWKRPVGVRF